MSTQVGANSIIKKQSKKDVLAYCVSDRCKGVPVKGKIEIVEEEEDLECPVCYESIKDTKVVMLHPCAHTFCVSCPKALENSKSYSCPMCRQTYSEKHLLNAKVKSTSNLIKIDDIKHISCHYRTSSCEKFMAEIGKEWISLAQFIMTTQIKTNTYGCIKGTQPIITKTYGNQLVSEDHSHQVFKSPQGDEQILFSCLMPNFSIRLLLKKREEIDVEIDNEYADNVVYYLNNQIAACWRVLPCLMNNEDIVHTFVRQFKNVTASLHLIGHQQVSLREFHHTPMRKTLGKLKKCNFDPQYFLKFRNWFPHLNVNDLKTPFTGLSGECCKNVSKKKRKHTSSE